MTTAIIYKKSGVRKTVVYPNHTEQEAKKALLKDFGKVKILFVSIS